MCSSMELIYLFFFVAPSLVCFLLSRKRRTFYAAIFRLRAINIPSYEYDVMVMY